jgi:sortase B
MKSKVLNLLISFVIVVCAFASVYSETTDYEYTNGLADILGTGDSTSEPDGVAVDEDNPILEITSVQSPQDVLDAINQAEEDGDASSANVEFQNFNIVSSYEYMKSINDDTIGWLNIPNMGSYPVMYCSDNSYYLTHSATGQVFENGAIFMNSYNDGDFEDISLIHGHHLRSGGMFGSLKKYKDEWFFNNNDLIEVYDGTNLKYFRPFSVFYYTDGEEYIPSKFSSDESKTEYIQSLLDRSMVGFYTEHTIRADNDLMILSTCDYEFENCRLAVACYEVLSIPKE